MEWLADSWELTAEDWSAALERQILRRRWQAELAQLVEDAGEQYERDDEGPRGDRLGRPRVLGCARSARPAPGRARRRRGRGRNATTRRGRRHPATLPPWLGISADENDPAVRRLAGIIAVAEERRRQEPRRRGCKRRDRRPAP